MLGDNVIWLIARRVERMTCERAYDGSCCSKRGWRVFRRAAIQRWTSYKLDEYERAREHKPSKQGRTINMEKY